LKTVQWSKLFIGVLLVALLLIPGERGFAQESGSEGPVYVVQEGDSLWDIAQRFRVSIDELSRVNGISDPSQLAAGARLVIPGLDGIQGELVTETVAFGETLQSLSRRYGVTMETLVRLNHLTSPAELYAGATLVIPKAGETAGATRRATVSPGQSLFELAVLKGANPWEYVIENDLGGTWDVAPSEVLLLQGDGTQDQAMASPGALPEAISQVSMDPRQFVQGKVFALKITGQEGLSLGGSLNDRPLHFFPDGNGAYVSLQGIHAMAEPGLYTMVLTGTLPSATSLPGVGFSFSQSVLIHSGDYYFDPVLIVSPETIDPAVTGPEDAQWAALALPATPQKMWTGVFQSPAPDPYKDCWPSLFGNRRSYNGSPYNYFHTGLDFCGGVGTEIMAPATGKVVFAGPLTVRGNATMIDHGWGIYSAYMHQSEILVSVGDMVEPGQVIGLVGGTGRVTGPHLHWEIWAGGVQVDPMDWLSQAYP
jgi:murein DD-endopeptidase MepM/ murein hydrolase activator NlpD